MGVVMRAFAAIVLALSLNILPPSLYVAKDHVYNVQFSGIINENSARDIISVFNQLQPGDRLNITLTSPGGEIIAGYKIIQAMQNAKSQDIHIYVPKEAASMAALWLCYANDVEVKPSAEILYHPVGIWSNGEHLYDLQDGRQLTPEEQIVWDQYKQSLQRCPVTSHEDLEIRIQDGQIWLHGSQLPSRNIHFHIY